MIIIVCNQIMQDLENLIKFGLDSNNNRVTKGLYAGLHDQVAVFTKLTLISTFSV